MLKKGDTIVVIAGKDKGKKGKVIFVDPENGTCLVEGVNIVIKHRKARSAKQKSSREKKPGAIHISNVQILCKCGKATRIGHKIVGDKKIRVCVKCQEGLDKKYVRVKEKVKEDDIEEKDESEKDKKIEKKPIQRREVKHTAQSNIKKPTVKTVTGHRKIGGGE
jgi:large subunit ribosomal protein L24